ncbi:MAG TPA: M56 family metallopeptidase [Pirellulales bacterium]|nr:M56 family metallopeptidase [Pirellulales bacterium]
MVSSQQIVVKWIEYAATGAVLLLAARLAVGRLRQPTDRIKLILMSFVVAAVIPVLVSLSRVPAWHLGIMVAADAEHRSPQAKTSASLPLALAAPPEMPATSEISRPAEGIAANDLRPPVRSNTDSPVGTPPSKFDVWVPMAIGLLIAHGFATAWFLAERLIGVRWLRRMAARAVPATPAVRAVWASVAGGRGDAVRLLVSNDVDTPLTYGFLPPTVVIPEPIADGDQMVLRFCLAHEWSHVASGDVAMWRLAWLCQFALWFQPLFWRMRRELRSCQDFVADHCAAGAGRDAVEYSELLLDFARQRMGRPVAGAIALLDRSSQLSRRVKMLLASPIALRSRSPLLFCLAAGSLLLVGAMLVSTVRLDSVHADDADQPASSEKTDKTPSQEQAAAEKPKQGETLHYTGVVLDKDSGKGIPNATVVVRRSKYSSEENTIIEETRHKTDAEGKYSFEIPPEQVAVSALYIELDVEHDDYAAQKGFGYALSMIRKNETLGERPFFEKVELRPSDPVTGTVVDPDGKPLAGVKIQGYSKANASDFRDYGSFTDTLTDDAGKFRLPLVKGGVGVFWVLPTEYASTSRAVDKERGDVGETRLRPGVRVSGRLLNTEGQPVAGIPVNIYYEGGGNETVNNLPVHSSIERSTITDRDGHFAFDPLPTGEYRVIPEEHRSDPIIRDRTRYEIPGVFSPMKVTIQEGVACAPIEIQASPYVLFNAQYLDSKGNKTRGHEVHVFGRMDGQFWFGQGRPNSEGTISMRIPHGMDVQLNLSTNEHGALRFRRGKGKDLENKQSRVEMGTLNDDVEEFEIIRYVAPIVLVNAADPDGKQVKDFRVTAAYPWGKQEYILEGEQRSDLSFEHQNDGRYRTSQMLPDEDVKFTVTAPGYEAASETVRLGEGETKDLVLTLKQKDEAAKPKAAQSTTLRYSGVVLDKETGKPIPDATVVVGRAKHTQQEEEDIGETRYMTDGDGKYSFEISAEELAIPGLYVWANAEHDGYIEHGDGALLSLIRKNESLGQRPPFEKLELRPAEPVVGTVVAPDGKPLGGVKLRGYTDINRLNRERGNWVDGTTDEAGRFRLNFVKGGVGMIWVLPTQYASTSRVVDKKRTDLGQIRLRPGVRVSGRVLSAEGKPLPKIPMTITYGGGGDEPDSGIPNVATSTFLRRTALTDDEGRFALDPVSTGNYRVTPEEYRLDPIVDDQTRYEIPGVFMPVSVKIQEGVASAPLEIQASPHILFNVRFVDSKGAPAREDEFFLSGILDGESWHDTCLPNAQGMTTLRVPHGVQNATVQFVPTEFGSVRFRRGKGKPLENHVFQAKLGTLNDDVDFEVVHYRAPIVLVNVVDDDGKSVKGFHVAAAYPWGKQVYTLEGELRSDLAFKRQSDGRYRTVEMLPDEDVKFTVSAPGYEAASETVRLGEGETKNLVLTLKKVVEATMD